MLFRSFLDFLFPPLCLACKELCWTKFLCLDCWGLSELPDPIERCRHCFEELDERENLCSQCREKRVLPVVRAYVFDASSPARLLDRELVEAMAGFAYFQWTMLEWPTPDAVIPMPDGDSRIIGLALAQFLERPFVRALRGSCAYREDSLQEEQELLLFDAGSGVDLLQKGALALGEAFPKRVRLLSLYGFPLTS